VRIRERRNRLQVGRRVIGRDGVLVGRARERSERRGRRRDPRQRDPRAVLPDVDLLVRGRPGAFQLRLICPQLTVDAVRPVGMASVIDVLDVVVVEVVVVVPLRILPKG
jgi:hypothetical protein